jgi:hypothetical protein
VAVRVQGLDEEEMQRVLVSGEDTYNREVELSFHDGAWITSQVIALKRLRLGIPDEAVEKLQQVDIEIGAARHRFGRHEIKKWRRLSREGLELFHPDIPAGKKKSIFSDLSEVMNWKGNGVFVRAYARAAVPVLAILALFLGLAFGLGRLADRWRPLRGLDWRPVRDSACLSALYLFYPIVIMKKSGALYYGGETGIIRDTVGSLIADSFYGIRYAARQESLSLAFILGTMIVFLLLLAWKRHR